MKKSLLACATVGAVLMADAAKVETIQVRSVAMDKDVPCSVILPEGYDGTAAKRWPVVYVLHGAGGNHQRSVNYVVTNLVDRYGFVAVGPDGGKTSWWLDSPIDPKYQYETFVINELLPHIETNYCVSTCRTKRGIMGGSMGGHGACYLGIRHKDLFGVIGNIYGGVDLVPWDGRWDIDKRLGPRNKFPERWAEYSVVNVAKSLKNGEVELITAVGTEDFFLGCNRQLHDLLSVNGVAHTYVEIRSPSTIQSVHGKFYNQGAEVCLRFINNYFRDGYGHLGDCRATQPTDRERVANLYMSHVHRGGGKLERPDNTLETFKWCWENGSALECDCRRTKDGVGIMLHDDRLKRTARGVSEGLAKKSVSKELTWNEIKDVDVGSYLGSQFAHHRIPTIEETFAAMKGHPTYLCFVDEKGAGPKYIADKARETGVIGQVYYSGPSYEKAQEWMRDVPDGKTMLWIGTWPVPKPEHDEADLERFEAHYEKVMGEIRAGGYKGISVVSLHSYYNPNAKEPFVPRASYLKKLTEEFHRHGIPVCSIPFAGGETQEAYFKLWELGMDGFSSDYPSVMFRVIHKLKREKMDFSKVDLKGIKGVVFDFGGVICQDIAPDAEIFKLWEGLGLTRSQWDRGFADYRKLWDSGKITPDEMYRRMLADNGIKDPDPALLEKLWRTDAEGYVKEFYPETLDFMRELKRKGIKVGILTNMAKEFYRDYFTKACHEYVAEADVVVVSAEEGLYKPDKALYDVAAKKIGLKPEELLFVDNLMVNVEGARAAGWNAIQFIE